MDEESKASWATFYDTVFETVPLTHVSERQVDEAANDIQSAVETQGAELLDRLFTKTHNPLITSSIEPSGAT
eukprot:COSAG02_NODE_12233_length_1576_cov_1.526066_2_plen_72_part_00